MRSKTLMHCFIATLGVVCLAGCHNSVAHRKEQSAENKTKTSNPKPQIVELHHKVVPASHLTAPSGPGAKPHKVAKVGMVAPDFELPAYQNGNFTKVKLSSLRGKWILLCFYPGDFTFV